MPCVVVAGRRGLKGREWMPEGKRYTATAQDGVEAIGQCTKNSHQEGGKEHGRKDNCHVHRAMCFTWYRRRTALIIIPKIKLREATWPP